MKPYIERLHLIDKAIDDLDADITKAYQTNKKGAFYLCKESFADSGYTMAQKGSPAYHDGFVCTKDEFVNQVKDRGLIGALPLSKRNMERFKGKRVKIRNKHTGDTLHGTLRVGGDWLVGCPVVDTDESGIVDLGYHHVLIGDIDD